LDLKSEFYYGTKYSSEKMSESQIQILIEAELFEGEKLGNAPENKFIPKESPAALQCSNPSVHPVLVRSEHGSCVWFKQDALFDQPLVWAHL
jgi:hypothetical protein